jgi:ABC-type phosphate/phosphonate transport system substrate-binding protein
MTVTGTAGVAHEDDLVVGAVAASPAIVTIWEGFTRWLNKRGLPIDYVLYSNYDRMVADLIDGHIDAAWNTPFAWIRAEQMAMRTGKELDAAVMRDIDFDLTSVIAVRADSDITSVSDLKGRSIGVGTPDSVESVMMPCGACEDAGLVLGEDFDLRHYSDVLGTHGGHQEGEVRAAQALVAGEVDAAGLSTGNYESFIEDGTIRDGATKVLLHTSPYDHCNLTVGASAPRELTGRMRELFLEMDRTDPELHEAMELEKVKQWKPARLTHYETLRRAMQQYDAAQKRRRVPT